MKDKLQFDYKPDHIRTLLNKYYEAETSPEEERLLESFFCNTPENEIPKDLTEDRLLFLSMTSLHPDQSSLVVPHNLVEKIDAIVDTPQISSFAKRQRHWKRRVAYTGIAAAVCAMITVGILNRPSQSTTRESVQSIGKLTDDGYIEITDPKEAERIALEIGQLLASNSKKTDEAFSRLTYAFDEYKEITKSVLK